jgi:hypothetical protein
MQTATRQRVLEAFEKHRAQPGAPFDELHFLDFLMPAPKTVGAIHNSFSGLRRFNRFIDDIQYEYAVCFSLADRETDHSLEKFVERINALQKSRQGSLKALKNQERAAAGWNVIVIAGLVLLCAACAFRRNSLVAVVLVALTIAVTVAFSMFAHRAAAYLRLLRSRIEADEDHKNV